MATCLFYVCVWFFSYSFVWLLLLHRLISIIAFITFFLPIDIGSWYVWTMILFGNVPLSLQRNWIIPKRPFLRLRITFEVTRFQRKREKNKRHTHTNTNIITYNMYLFRWLSSITMYVSTDNFFYGLIYMKQWFNTVVNTKIRRKLTHSTYKDNISVRSWRKWKKIKTKKKHSVKRQATLIPTVWMQCTHENAGTNPFNDS